jgi:membrane protein DedA with SNARE-associated domain
MGVWTLEEEMIEFIILLFAAAAAFCVGNIVGYSSGRKYGEKKATFDTLMKCVPIIADREREQMIDHISRQSLAFSQKQKQWIKVYDAEVTSE